MGRCTALWLLLAAAPAFAQTAAPPATPAAGTLTQRVRPPAKLTVGDRFDVTLVVTAPPKSLVTGPLTDSLGVFLVGGEQRRTRSKAGRDETTYELSMAGFQAGRHRLPQFVFLVRSGAHVDTLRSDTLSLLIASVLPAKMDDIHDLKPPEAFPNRLLWIVPAAIVLLGLLAWLAWRLYRRLRRVQELAAAPPPPWDEAIAALDAMPWREWLEAGQVKRYYYALSEVLKRYIERRFEFHAVEQTTTEMLASMRVHKTPMREDVARFFQRSDLVKYAKSVPEASEAEGAIDEVRAFVMRTKPQEPVAAAPGAATAGVTTGSV